VGQALADTLRALQAISKIEGLEYQVTPMATILMGAKRISSILRIDELLDKPRIIKVKTEIVKD
jgi:uncharacterized protein YqgV (UPF0045/DUF77 family)